MQKGLLITICALLAGSVSYPQSEFSAGDPKFPDISSWYSISVDKSAVEALLTAGQSKDQPYQFAIPVAVILNPSNAGVTFREGDETVWLMPVESKGALSLNAIVEPFDLPDGAYFYVYDDLHTVVRGAYTNESGNALGSLPLLPVPGERMVIECHFPGKTIPSSAIGIKQVAHDFAGFFRLAGSKDQYYGASGSCEIDINCSSDPDYLRTSNSVCRLLINGTTLCTGVMVNTTGMAFKPYVLTAQHCISTNADANNSVFLFNYSSPWCDGPDQNITHSVAGAVLTATNSAVDFSLVEMVVFPSIIFRPYFSGWDITGSVPTQTYSIHHPEGDVMKLSRDTDPPATSSYPAGDYQADAFWRILRWDMGTTENGSSGGPLFDQNNRLIGTLTGGSADCLAPVSDYFAKLPEMFDVSAVPSKNLKAWLDPASTGALVTGAMDPYAFNLAASDTLLNIPKNNPVMTDHYLSPGFGYSTGLNSDSILYYAEYFPFTGTGEITWVHLGVAFSSWLSRTDSVKVFVFSGGAIPGTAIASRTIKLETSKNDFDLEIDFGKTVKVAGPYYIGYRVFYKSPLEASQPQFSLYHSTPYVSQASNTAWFNDGTAWKPFTQHPSFPMATSLEVKVIMVENSIPGTDTTETPPGSVVKAFPIPFTSSLSFTLDTKANISILDIFDHTGNIVSSCIYNNIFPGTLTVELPFMAPGIYHYRIKNDSVISTGTVIKIKEQ